jgi:phosphoglycolate phosphatase-like HAD superfamily hydrolase
MDRIIVFDFSGTVIKREVAEEASRRRLEWLGKTVSKEYLRKALPRDKHFKVNKKLLSKYTGIKDEKMLTMFSTDLFKIHMLAVANEMRQKMFREGIIKVIKKLRKDGFKIGIMSGIRSDIIFNMLKITKTDDLIDYVCAQNPTLTYSNKQLLECIKNAGKIEYVIGDKLTDLVAAKQTGAKSIFLRGGHPLGGEEKKADFIVETPDKILEII